MDKNLIAETKRAIPLLTYEKVIALEILFFSFGQLDNTEFVKTFHRNKEWGMDFFVIHIGLYLRDRNTFNLKNNRSTAHIFTKFESPRLLRNYSLG